MNILTEKLFITVPNDQDRILIDKGKEMTDQLETPYRSNALSITKPIKTWRMLPLRLDLWKCPWCHKRTSFVREATKESAPCNGRRFLFFGPFRCPKSVRHLHCYCRSCHKKWIEQAKLEPIFQEPEGTISVQ